MGVTRGYWGEFGLVVALTGAAALLAEPLVLVGAAGVGGWLVARHYAFVRAVSDAAASLAVTQSPERERLSEDDSVTVALEATLPDPAPLDLDVRADAPVGVEVDDSGTGDSDDDGTDSIADDGPSVTLPAGEREATAAFEARCPLAGEFRFDRPTVTTADESGRFTARFATGEPATVTVDARGPRDLHVGTGGDAIDTPYGDLDTGERGVGLDFAELRSYVPGDAVRNIDWKATARFDEAYVRTYETTAERRIALLVDCRSAMATGPAGATKFDYLRRFALGMVEYARQRSEPLGLYAVGDEGLIANRAPAADVESYAAAERRLRELAPGDAAESDRRAPKDTSPAIARQRARRLQADDSAYAERLEPFFAAADPYVERIEGDPLYGAVRSSLSRVSGALTTVVLTDDSNRARTRAAVRAAARGDGTVLAFLTPTILFERDGGDPEATYERYADFERFRRELANERGVAAFEVAPGDELSRLLAGHRARRRAAEAGD
ncbi:DUF58 domain-containing protein (plasmid) [Halorussus limi]|uniref:DUF58 domain-containing protein n=1 Tax=Halorussus limi TaxID=2938695 RepID=A0A8U0I0I2_9EURY|nr:DUF58 domain-containing protein [Halorussus limi]UPV76649.1 DUF58 domain-containing protein [Halorussus limi]